MKNKDNQDWEEQLTPEQFHVCRQKGTERPFTGKYWDDNRRGEYYCACCNASLFNAESKFDSGSGWPSFYQPSESSNIDEHKDSSHGMIRTEVTCRHCDSHLGHVFPDGPAPTGLRYCINSVSIRHEEDENLSNQG